MKINANVQFHFSDSNRGFLGCSWTCEKCHQTFTFEHPFEFIYMVGVVITHFRDCQGLTAPGKTRAGGAAENPVEPPSTTAAPAPSGKQMKRPVRGKKPSRGSGAGPR